MSTEAAPKGGHPATGTGLLESSPSHLAHMRQLAVRIRWLERHRHWWLRTPEGQEQLEFIERRDAA